MKPAGKTDTRKKTGAAHSMAALWPLADSQRISLAIAPGPGYHVVMKRGEGSLWKKSAII